MEASPNHPLCYNFVRSAMTNSDSLSRPILLRTRMW